MRLNRDVLIHEILENQGCFFRLLDYIDQHDGSNEVPEALYLDLYYRVICEKADDNVARHLSIKSLLENGVFIHNDRNTGMITIERVLVDLLRFLDNKRAKELTHIDFELLRRQTADVVREVKNAEDNSQRFEDAMSAMNRLMSEIHSKVKESVSNLTIQVERIAHDYKLFETGNTADTVFKLYERIDTLYSRYVMPCYEFIDAKLELVGSENFATLVQSLIDHLSSPELQAYDVALSLQLRRTAITCYYKDINILARKLEQFSQHLERDRDYFLAIESAFTQLIENVENLRHGKQRNKYLTPNNSFFSQFESFNGLKERKSTYSSRFNWHGEISLLRFKEYLTILQQDTEVISETPLLPLSRAPYTSDPKREIEIARAMRRISVPKIINDVHAHVHQHLLSTLDDYSLTDLLLGLESFLPILAHDALRLTTERERLNDEHYYFDYLKLLLNTEADHV